MFIPDQFSRKGRGTEPNWFVDTIPTDPLHARRNTAAANTVVLKSSLTAGSRLARAEFGSGIGESHAAPAAPAFVVRRGQGRPIWHRFAIRASDTFMSGCRHRVLAIRWIAATCRALRVRCSGGGNTEFAGDPFEDEKVVHRGPAHHRHCLPTGISTRGNATDRERSPLPPASFNANHDHDHRRTRQPLGRHYSRSGVANLAAHPMLQRRE